MSNACFNNLDYEQFEVSANNEMYKSRNSKIKREMKRILKKKFEISKLMVLCISFFLLFIILMIIYIKNAKEYNNLESKVMDRIFFPYHSDLIPTLKTLKKLKRWIEQIILEKRGIEYKPSFRMYFKATVDGDSSFHDKTDKWDGYILLIKDENENIFGGYTSKNFRGNLIADFGYGAQKNDNIAFLFNLDKDEIYPVIDTNSDNHIYGDIEEGPVFGELHNSDLFIQNKFLSVKSYSGFPNSYNLKGNKNTSKNKLRLTNGQKYFLIKELEVFRVNLLT